MLGDSEMTLRLGAAHVIVVESGALTIEETPPGSSSVPEFSSDSQGSPVAEPVVALPGLAVVATSHRRYRIANEGHSVASALLIRIAGQLLPVDQPGFGAFGTSQNDPGVQIDILSTAIELGNRAGPWKVEIGRATLAPGTVIPPHEVAGAELMLVEQGALDARLSACDQHCVQTIEGAGAFATDRAPVQAGQGISAGDGATTEYLVTGSTPATLLIVTVTPAR
jgi:hypothetical protein